MSKDRGWKPFMDESGIIGRDDAIEYDGDSFTGFASPDAWDPIKDFKTYLETLFKPDECVGYVTNDVWQDSERRWVPSKGVFYKTAAGATYVS